MQAFGDITLFGDTIALWDSMLLSASWYLVTPISCLNWTPL
jgi:hypothetical protein